MEDTQHQLTFIYSTIIPPQITDQTENFYSFGSLQGRVVCLITGMQLFVNAPFEWLDAFGALIQRIAGVALVTLKAWSDLSNFPKAFAAEQLLFLDSACYFIVFPPVRMWVLIRFALGALLHPQVTNHLPFLDFDSLFQSDSNDQLNEEIV